MDSIVQSYMAIDQAPSVVAMGAESFAQALTAYAVSL